MEVVEVVVVEVAAAEAAAAAEEDTGVQEAGGTNLDTR